MSVFTEKDFEMPFNGLLAPITAAEKANRILKRRERKMSEQNKQYLLQFFTYAHLPPHLQEVSKWFAEAAERVSALPANPEQTTALRKLLEAKDCAVRALLFK